MKDYFLLRERRNHEADLFKICFWVPDLDAVGSVEPEPDSESDSGPERLKFHDLNVTIYDQKSSPFLNTVKCFTKDLS
jgi:hypothetical protein